MGTWLADNWYVITGIVGTIALVAYRVHERGGDESLPRRVLYVFAPTVDPKSEKKLSLLGAGLLLIFTIVFIVVYFMIDDNG